MLQLNHEQRSYIKSVLADIHQRVRDTQASTEVDDTMTVILNLKHIATTATFVANRIEREADDDGDD